MGFEVATFFVVHMFPKKAQHPWGRGISVLKWAENALYCKKNGGPAGRRPNKGPISAQGSFGSFFYMCCLKFGRFLI